MREAGIMAVEKIGHTDGGKKLGLYGSALSSVQIRPDGSGLTVDVLLREDAAPRLFPYKLCLRR